MQIYWLLENERSAKTKAMTRKLPNMILLTAETPVWNACSKMKYIFSQIG